MPLNELPETISVTFLTDIVWDTNDDDHHTLPKIVQLEAMTSLEAVEKASRIVGYHLLSYRVEHLTYCTR